MVFKKTEGGSAPNDRNQGGGTMKKGEVYSFSMILYFLVEFLVQTRCNIIK